MKQLKRRARIQLNLYFFYREQSSECQQSRIILERVLPKFSGLLYLLEINYDLQRDICRDYNVYGIPTLVITHNNRVINRYSGILDKEKLEDMLIQALQRSVQ